MVLSIMGLLFGPALLWLWGFYHLNKYKRSNIELLSILFVSGMACGLIALLLNHLLEKYTMFWSGATEEILFGINVGFPFYRYGFWMIIGFNEELAKLVVLLIVTYPSRYLQEPLDGILFAAIVGLGFATVENLFYWNQYGNFIIASRSMITLPAHIFMTTPMGYFLARSKLHHQHISRSNQSSLAMHIILIGWISSGILHGTYDLWLSVNWVPIAYFQIVMMGLLTLWMSRRLLKFSRPAPTSIFSLPH